MAAGGPVGVGIVKSKLGDAGHPTPPNAAVYVVGVAGAVTLWVCPPPSDHDLNVCETPPTVCGLGALTLFDEPTITVRVVGAVTDCAPTPSCSPVGVVAKVRFTVLGSSWRLVLACAPAESVALRTRDNDEGYSWSGAGNVAEATPV